MTLPLVDPLLDNKKFFYSSISINNNNGLRSGYSCETQSAVTIDDLVRYDEKLQTDIAIFQRPLIQCHTINSYINLSLVAYKAFYIS
jgi:hypothetical protein